MPRQKKQHLAQRADGRYRCKYKDRTFYGRTEKEALDAREAYRRSLLADPFRRDNIRLSVYGERWLKAHKGHLTPGPYNTHKRMLDRLVETTGDAFLRDVRPTDVELYYQQFAGKSRSLICDARDTVRGLFRAALADGYIDRDPAAAVTPPKGTAGTHREITDAERDLIHRTQHRLRPAVMVMLYAGLRRGEVMALNVSRDVDFAARTVTVREAVRFDSQGHPEVVDPKTEAGARVVPLLPGLAAELQGITGPLCLSASGEPMTESAWSRAWESYLYALAVTMNGRPRSPRHPWPTVSIRPHDLRHSFCTMLYNAGVDLKTAMLWMGHADQTMTMRVYTHLTEARQAKAAADLLAANASLFAGRAPAADPAPASPALPPPDAQPAVIRAQTAL